MMTGGFISDAWYISSIWLDLGSGVFFNPANWSAEIAFTMVTTLVPMALKVTFIMGLGTGEKSKATTKQQ